MHWIAISRLRRGALPGSGSYRSCWLQQLLIMISQREKHVSRSPRDVVGLPPAPVKVDGILAAEGLGTAKVDIVTNGDVEDGFLGGDLIHQLVEDLRLCCFAGPRSAVAPYGKHYPG